MTNTTTNTIITKKYLNEKCNDDNLALVIKCDNFPRNDDCDEDDLYFKSLPARLYSYSKIPRQDDGTRQIEYTQKLNGRFNSNTIQKFSRDIRSFLLTDSEGQPMYTDVDIRNCHPVILEHLFKKHVASVPTFLTKYNNDREGTIKEFKLKDKMTIIKLINSESYKSYYNEIQLFHTAIYGKGGLYDKLKVVYKGQVDCKVKNNKAGSFMSQVLQMEENIMLQSMVTFLEDRGYTVGIWMFDGCMIEGNHTFDLNELSDYIFQQTDYRVEISFKDVATDWKPIEKDNIDKRYSKEFASSLMGQAGFMDYMNNYMCKIYKPASYGWRLYPDEDYTIVNKSTLWEHAGFHQVSEWCKYDNWKCFNKKVFKVPSADPGDYNLYKEPESYPGQEPTLFLEYIKEVICSNDQKLYDYMLQYIHELLRKGITYQCLVLMGEKGIGKSSLTKLLGYLVGEDYFITIKDLEQLTNNFNVLFEKSILISVEELPANAGEYRKIQAKLKSMITESLNIITSKGFDSYQGRTFNSFILVTNEMNPVQITEGNRRFCIIKVNSIYKGKPDYFVKMEEYVKSNLPTIRHYFKNLQFDKLLEENRPTTEAEMAVYELNLEPVNEFIRDVLCDNHVGRKINELFDEFTVFCFKRRYKMIDSRYFKAYLEKSADWTLYKDYDKSAYKLKRKIDEL